jgi:hypothetical protein
VSEDDAATFRAAQRGEFVRAFLDQSWARPGLDRPVSRVHVAVMVAVGSLVAAVVTGAVLQLVHPVKLAEPVAMAPVVPSPAVAVAVAGWDCATAADRGFTIGGRTPTWYTVAHGGWSDDGCHGTFEAISLSGNATKNDPNQSAVWWFVLGDTMNSCQLALYLPAVDHPGDAAVTTAQYTVLSGQSGGPLASVTVDQTATRGGWRDLGAYPVTRGNIAVRLDNQGVPRAATDRLAVTQVRARCSEGM